MGVAGRSAGTLAVLASAGLVAAGRRPGAPRWLATGAGLVVIGLVVATLAAHAVAEDADTSAANFVAIGLAAAVALPSTAMALRAASPAWGVDAALGACLAAELGLITLLFRASSGAWFNYAIPAAVFAATLGGRALSCALAARVSVVVASPAILAAAAVLITNLYEVHRARWDATIDGALMSLLDANIDSPRESWFVVGRPGFNRLDGRLDLVYDDWLYPVFESTGRAEPRSQWLGRALLSGPVRVVVNNTDGPLLRGTGIDLRLLGYRHGFKADPDLYVWVR
jgi:hypothetical protein